MKHEDIIREVQTLLPEGQDGYQIAKAVFKLSEKPAGTFQQIGKSGRKRPMSQSEAARLVAAARKRIELADEGETSEPGEEPSTPEQTESEEWSRSARGRW